MSPLESLAQPFDLATVQRMMVRAITAPMGPRQRMRREHAATASAIIRPNARLTSRSRLEIYHQQFWWRLQATFMEDFPGLRAVLGVRRFDRLMNAYLAACGSTSWNLRDLGQHLDAFLREYPALSAPFETVALDMARVEWAKIVAFDGAELPRFDIRLLSGNPAKRLRIGLQPFLSLLEISHPVDRMLGHLGQRKARSRSVSPSRQTIYLAVHRQEFAVYYKRLEPGEYHLLTGLRADIPLESACAQAMEKSVDTTVSFGAKIQEWFATWTQLGWLCEAR